MFPFAKETRKSRIFATLTMRHIFMIIMIFDKPYKQHMDVRWPD